MSHFVVSARKYRPKNFQEVIGQFHITTTLKHALADNKLAHALLFCGPRGVGKTTCARILAKSLNCLSLSSTLDPCNTCTSCISFQINNPMNVFELDAASNNSVEDIRNLVSQVRYVPQVGKFKIYIIDEVHMLSNAAFNAFLKTLEEPPSHVIFILATTERHKVLPTIVSRCQVFNFNRISIEDIVKQLQIVATKQQVQYERSALQVIAQKSEGAMRDALSMYDLVQTFIGAEGKLTYDATCQYLHVLDCNIYFQCTDAFLQGNVAEVLALYDVVWRQGFDGYRFVVGLGEHLRNLLICKDAKTESLLEVTDNLKPLYVQYASQFPLPFLLASLALVNQCNITYKYSQNQRLHVELLLVELASSFLPDKNPLSQDSNYIGQSQTTNSIPTNTIKPSKQVNAKSNAKVDNSPFNLEHNLFSSQCKDNKVTLPNLEALKVALQHQLYHGDTKQEVKQKQESVTLDQVKSFFIDYSKHLRHIGHISAALLLQNPIQLQGEVIVISFKNSMEEHLFQNIQPELLEQLRKRLHNDNITIHFTIVPPVSKQKPTTDQEKLDFLSKKNSAISLLKARFLLEVGY